jgi:predicted transcriptional regulator
MSRTWSITVDEFIDVAKALSNETRIEIFKQIQKRRMNVNEIAEMFGLPSSTATVNIKKLEDAKLIKTELISGARGSQKVCSALYDRLLVDLTEHPLEAIDHFRLIQMPIGHYTQCEAAPTCGLASEVGIIGYLDDPRSFYEPDKVRAQLIWFKHGYLEYQLPNKLPYDAQLTGLEISMEICSEAPLHNADWPSDITVWVNGVEVGTWMSPADFGGEPGWLTPAWWEVANTQYGLLKKWRITGDGSYIDGRRVSDKTVRDLAIDGSHFFTVRVGVKPDAINTGGLNIFGSKFGNYEQDLLVRMDFEHRLNKI